MSKTVAIKIEAVGPSEPVAYAAEEVARCLSAAYSLACKLAGPGDVLIGDSESLAARPDLPAHGIPADRMPEPDPFVDEVLVDVVFGDEGPSGVICGSNPRSALLAAYRFLHALGYRWLHPGDDGEVAPSGGELSGKRIRLAERPSYPHRGVCIEGAVSYEHVCDVITWLPRVGMNAYFIQFREAFTFFDRWYSRHPRQDGAFTPDDARSLVDRVAEEIAKRGLLYHAVGHGWTCEPFGIPGLEWEEYTEPVPDEVSRYFAELDGTRTLYGGIPLNTNLCYSNPEVRSTMIDAIVDYAAGHPEVSHLHVWLADGSNNNCECDECRRLRPSDFYVMMLNDLDEKLSAEGIDTKIVFLIYVDLLWPPEKVELRASDRFVLMFAPITRSYAEPFVADGAAPSTAGLPSPYVRNELEFPRSPSENLAYLDAWRTQFAGDSFDFDYHLMWDHYLDPGSMNITKTLHADVRNLAELGLDGYMSCQVQRASFPTGLPMYTLAATLWDRSRSLEDVRAEYFEAAFGGFGDYCLRYLTRLSELFAPLLADGANAMSTDYAADFEAARALATSFVDLLPHQNGAGGETAAQHTAIDRLRLHAELTAMLADAVAASAHGRQKAAQRKWDVAADRAFEVEERAHTVFDAVFYTKVIGGRLFGR